MVDQRFICDKCGSENLKVLQANKKTGLYCKDCGKWVRWLNRKKDVRDAYTQLISDEEIRCRAIKVVRKYGGLTTIRCEKCNCLLFSSDAEPPVGQFDLIDASFCPKCGAEFVEEYKKFHT